MNEKANVSKELNAKHRKVKIDSNFSILFLCIAFVIITIMIAEYLLQSRLSFGVRCMI